MVLCFIGSPARRRIGYAARETAARRERVHARDTEKDRERERASEPASDRRTRLRSVALEDQPEKHSMGQIHGRKKASAAAEKEREESFSRKFFTVQFVGAPS